MFYVFFVIRYERRQIVRFAVTPHPYAEWVILQLREAFPFDTVPRYLILDRDGKYGDLVPRTLKSWGVKPARTSWNPDGKMACRSAGCCQCADSCLTTLWFSTKTIFTVCSPSTYVITTWIAVTYRLGRTHRTAGQ